MEANNDVDDTTGDGSDVVHGYEQLRARALSGEADGWRLGLGVLQQHVTSVLVNNAGTLPTHHARNNQPPKTTGAKSSRHNGAKSS